MSFDKCLENLEKINEDLKSIGDIFDYITKRSIEIKQVHQAEIDSLKKKIENLEALNRKQK